MKRRFTLKIVLTLTISMLMLHVANAQAPEKMSYQAVLRDSNSGVIANQSVGIQVSILQGSATGNPVYIESHKATTNINGLVSLEIGTGNTKYDFSTIDWSAGPYYIKTENYTIGGTNYTITGTSQLMSVPYALHAKTADSIAGGVLMEETDPLFSTSIAAGITPTDTAKWNNQQELPLGGTSGQILSTNGVGSYSWIDVTAGVSVNDAIIDGVTVIAPSQNAVFDALILKAPIASPTFTGTVSGIDKTMVGLTNVDNNSDADKPVSTATQTELDLKEAAANKSTDGTLATNSDDLFPTEKAVKTYVDAIAASGVADASTTAAGKIQLTGDLAGTATAPTVPGLTLKAPIADPAFTGTVSGVTSAMVGLGNVDNTSDANKPVSTATQTALDLKAPLTSPTFTGIPFAPTPGAATDNTQIATTAFVQTVAAAADNQTATEVASTATGTIAATNVQAALAEIDNEKLALAGGTMTGALAMSSQDISGVGTVTANSFSGTWEGNTLPVDKGGTGATNLTGYVKANGALSAMTASSTIPSTDVTGLVTTVNAIGPDAGGNVSVLIGNVTTGTLAAKPAIVGTNGDIYVVSGDATADNNGRTFISDGSAWNEVTSNQAATDARYLRLAGGTMSGDIALGAYKLTGVADPISDQDAATKAYVDAASVPNATVIGKVLTGYVSGAGTVAATDNILEAIQKLDGNNATNANLTGMVTSAGNAASLGSFTSANLLNAVTDETGTGVAVFATSPILVTPVLGTPASGVATNLTGLPLTTGVTGTLPVANGGTGATTLTGLVKGNGTATMTAAVVGTDYQAPLALTTTGTGAATLSGATLNIPTPAGSVADGTIAGDMLYWNGSAWVKVTAGTNGQTLTFYNGAPVWTGRTADVNTVTGANGKIWMDRNLGATQVATSSTDAASYGDLYQWGRGADGHQSRTSATTATLSSTDNPGHGNFITTSAAPYDWRSPQNTNLWQGVDGVNNPCPSGYRLPTEPEWNAEKAIWTVSDATGAFASPLKLPVAGRRSSSFGSLSYVGVYGYYWSSTVSSTSSRNLSFSSSNAGMSTSSRAYGVAVRCLKD